MVSSLGLNKAQEMWPRCSRAVTDMPFRRGIGYKGEK